MELIFTVRVSAINRQPVPTVKLSSYLKSIPSPAKSGQSRPLEGSVGGSSDRASCCLFLLAATVKKFRHVDGQWTHRVSSDSKPRCFYSVGEHRTGNLVQYSQLHALVL